jgi:hypothetical protein
LVTNEMFIGTSSVDERRELSMRVREGIFPIVDIRSIVNVVELADLQMVVPADGPTTSTSKEGQFMFVRSGRDSMAVATDAGVAVLTGRAVVTLSLNAKYTLPVQLPQAGRVIVC